MLHELPHRLAAGPVLTLAVREGHRTFPVARPDVPGLGSRCTAALVLVRT
jgi:hypothetical protein